ncbi:MAG: VWA domain-containing protein [Pseudohongiellaceae bacterium]|nr:VWA domain-containing protein [Pseudohongiellaceae bacterium]
MNEATTMASMMADFHFLRPLWLLALLPAIILVAYLWRLNETASAWDKAIDKDLLAHLLDNTKTLTERTPLILLLSLWTLIIIALAGPVWQKIAQPVQERQDALVIVYDQSLSMYATDYDPNRLTVSKRKLLDVLNQRYEGQTGLIVYAGEAYTVTPLTEDSVTITALVPSISPNIMPSFGSNVVAGVSKAKELLVDAGTNSGVILLITDGVERSEHAAVSDLLAGTGYRLSVLGVGTTEGATIPVSGGDMLRDASGAVVVPKLDAGSLRDLAAAGGGRYADMELSNSDIDYLLAEDLFFGEEELNEVDENFDIWYETGPWLLILALPFCALMFRRGWILMVTVVLGSSLLLPSQPAEAIEWKDLWKTKDQQGAEAFEQGNAQEAAALFESPEWRGAAAYRAQDYEGAIQAYTSGPIVDADSHYNLGNAYAQTRAFEQAIASYNLAIATEPDHEDAIKNREIVQSLLEEQQQQQEQEDQENEEGSEEEEQGDQQENQDDSEEEEQQQEQQQEQEDQEQEGEEEEQEESEQQDGQEQEEAEEDDQAEQPNMSNSEAESQESLEQWLRRIDDDPGELLQRKFQFEYRRQQLQNRAGNRRTQEQIW